MFKSNKVLFTKNFLTYSECDKLIKLLNYKSFNRAHQFHYGRNNNEFFSSDPIIKKIIVDKINKFKLSRKSIKYFSPIFEFYHYGPGNFISSHKDSPTKINFFIKSNYTAIIYLNDDFVGGETYFTELKLKIKPEKGGLLLFKHNIIHEASKVFLGNKLIYRSNWLIK